MAKGAGQEYSIKQLMKGNILVLTVSRIVWSMSVVNPYQPLFIQALGVSGRG